MAASRALGGAGLAPSRTTPASFAALEFAAALLKAGDDRAIELLGHAAKHHPDFSVLIAPSSPSRPA